MVDLTEPFHMGVVVSNLEEAMEFYSAGTGLTWHSPQSLDVEHLVEGHVVATNVRFTYSVEGPVQVELVEGPIGSFWDPNVDAGTYHMGYWTEDLRGDLDVLTDAGWTVRFTRCRPDGCPAASATSSLPTASRSNSWTLSVEGLPSPTVYAAVIRL